jgi:hypothetical protein
LGALGKFGGGLCFEGLRNSIAIEIDIYKNSANGDPTDPHIAIMRNPTPTGTNCPSHSSCQLGSLYLTPSATNGYKHRVNVTYNSPNKNIKVYYDSVLAITQTLDLNQYIVGGWDGWVLGPLQGLVGRSIWFTPGNFLLKVLN